MTSCSPFTITPREANQLLRQGPPNNDSNRDYYLIHITFQAVYGQAQVPYSVCKKLPRLLNGIPFGAGHLSNDSNEIRWRFVESQAPVFTFLSIPLLQTEAEESKRHLKDRLLTQSQAIFGDVTVKANISLSKCLSFDADLFINDIADSFDTGLHFKDS